jgi:hypothetical protein
LLNPEETYRARAAGFAAERDALHARWNRVSNLRLALFVLTLVAGGLGLWLGAGWLYALAGALALGFVAAVAYHTALGQRRRRKHELWAINDEGLRRARRDWGALPLRAPADNEAGAPFFAGDLDLLGHASLQHLLSTPATPVGLATLRGWLLAPASPDTIAERQAAVAELAPLNDFRDQFALLARLMDAPPDDEPLLAWAEGGGWLLARPWLVWLSRLLGALALGALVAQLALGAPALITLALVFVNGLLTFGLARRVEGALGVLTARQPALQSYAALFELVAAQRLASPLLARLHRALAGEGADAGRQMRRLALIAGLASIRSSIFYLPIQLLSLWSFHVLWMLERWQRDAGRHARAWIAACGEVEALAALATLRHDQPGWAFPEVVAGEPALVEARGLGHPLLPDAARVGNDVSVGPPGSFLLVTGSNMSGKSTLLRALGLNAVLAQAGAPVCAQSMRLPPLALATSMRVSDSLEAGVSFFMAELQRLKLVVDAAEAARGSGRALLFLLDEILQGTNTTERQIAARRIIRHLVVLGAIGAVSTHDLSLADAPDLREARRAVYFTESITRTPEGPAIHFDYTLRPGIATSTNALVLLELVGLPREEAGVRTED